MGFPVGSIWKRWLAGRPVAVVALVAGLWAAMGALPAQAAGLKLGLAPFPSMGLAHVAVARNYFEQQGLKDFEVVPCVNGGECLDRLERGEFDLTLASDIAITLATQQGRQMEVIATVAQSRRSNQFIARKLPGLNTPADLRGRRIGYIKGTSSHYFVEAFLSFHGISANDVTLVELQQQRAAEQLVNGEVDAAALFQPQAPRAIQALGSTGQVFEVPGLYTVTVNVVGHPGIADGELQSVIRALEQAEKFILSQPAEAARLLAPRLNLSQEAVVAALADFDFRIGFEQSLLIALESQARWARRSALVPVSSRVDYLSLMRVGPMKQVAPRRVTLIR